MLFNSGVFLQFFGAFLLLYYCCRNHLRARNWLIVAASYFFYGWWDYRFLALLLLSSLVDFFAGRALDQSDAPRSRKLLLIASMAVNLGILGFFKYFDFFIESFADLLGAFGLQPNVRALGILLPAGISFYTFQTMSYTIDIYRREIRAAPNLVEFLAFVSFFPQLVAGPIERARHLLPQFSTTRVINADMIREGIWLCTWGMFKKVVIADNLAPLVEMAFGSPNPGGLVVVLGTIAFAFQIYGDFSGYSDLARGTAKILGFDIMVNFNAPYSASSPREFWTRWHISLSTWLRDYLYIPLGGNRLGAGRTKINLLVTMLLGGLWHGARWNFILWGAWHGLALFAHRAIAKQGTQPAPRWTFAGWAATSLVVLYGWLLFRAESWQHIVALNGALLDWNDPPQWLGNFALSVGIFITPVVGMQTWQRMSGNLLVPLALRPWALALLEGILISGIVLFWGGQKVPFIYFQF